MMLGNHIVKTWAATQNVIATSSGEAEYYAMTKAASQALGMKALMADLGFDLKIKISTDASAAQGIAARRGLGQVRHIEVGQLWLQEKVNKGQIVIEKVWGKTNMADALTKHVNGEDHAMHIKETGLLIAGGRHELAPAREDGEEGGENYSENDDE